MISSYRQQIDRLRARHEMATLRASEERESKVQVDKRIESIEEAQKIVQVVASHLQFRAQEQISRVVSRCLNAVFDEPYHFSIRFDAKRGKTEAHLVFRRDGVEFDDPMNSIGGGVIDVASLALRLACILLAVPRRRRMIVLDEPFRNIRGKDYKQRVRQLLLRMAGQMGFQFILNVDADSYPEFALGKIVDLGSRISRG